MEWPVTIILPLTVIAKQFTTIPLYKLHVICLVTHRKEQTMSDNDKHVCPVERAGGLDNRFRRWLQNPRKILAPFVKEGMTVMDVGCGPGFFTLDVARMAGESGRAIASDLQEGMLEIVRKKIQGTDLEDRVILHRCGNDKIGWTEPIDFALVFYVVHEMPDSQSLFEELYSILKPGGRVLVVEPPIHVSKKAFREMTAIAQAAGFTPEPGPKMLFSKTVVLTKD